MKLIDWFEIPEKEYMWYILQGYEIRVKEINIMWRLNDKLHREDGPAYIFPSGTRSWWINGRRHRTDGPAVEAASGVREWWENGKLHRIDGPARIFEDGTRLWYLNGKKMTEAEWKKQVETK